MIRIPTWTPDGFVYITVPIQDAILLSEQDRQAWRSFIRYLARGRAALRAA